jgi:hypothetical protein
MSNIINDNVLLSCSTLNLNTGLCYCFVVDKDYNACRASFNTTIPGDVKRTEKVRLFDDERAVVDDFVDDFIRHDAEKDFDFDAVFEIAVNREGYVKSAENNQDLEARTYQLIDSITFNHQELSDDKLHKLSDIQTQKVESPVLKKLKSN